MKRLPQRSAARRGFTLIEVMITVAIVAILAAIAIPSYRDYIIRGRLTNATNGLAATRADMERHFQDNRSYGTVGAFVSPCSVARTFGDFTVDCVVAPGVAATATTYTLRAAGSGVTAGFGFTVTENDVRRTTTTVAGWGPAGSTCWIVRRGQTCP